MKLLKGGKVAIGGDAVEEQRYISPTVLRDCQLTDPAMQDEVRMPCEYLTVVTTPKGRGFTLSMEKLFHNCRVPFQWASTIKFGGIPG